MKNSTTPEAILNVEQLEDRCVPIVHSFSASVIGQVHSPNAAGTQATQAILQALGGTPVPVVASDGHAGGVPFDFAVPHAPGRDVVLAQQ